MLFYSIITIFILVLLIFIVLSHFMLYKTHTSESSDVIELANNISSINALNETTKKVLERTSINSDRLYNEFPNLFNSLDLYIIRTDTNYKIIDMNSSARLFFNIKNNSVDDIYDFFNRLSVDSEKVKNLIDQRNYESETLVACHDKVTDSDLYFNIYVHVEKLSDKNTSIYFIIKDVTYNQLLEKKILNREEFYKSILYNDADYMAILDKDGYIIYKNNSLEKGCELEKGKSYRFSELLHPDDRNDFETLLENFIKNPTDEHLDKNYRIMTNGRYEWNMLAIDDKLGNSIINGIIINSRNISYLIKYQDMLEFANKMAQELFSSQNISKWLNTVLSTAGHYLESEAILLFKRDTENGDTYSLFSYWREDKLRIDKGKLKGLNILNNNVKLEEYLSQSNTYTVERNNEDNQKIINEHIGNLNYKSITVHSILRNNNITGLLIVFNKVLSDNDYNTKAIEILCNNLSVALHYKGF